MSKPKHYLSRPDNFSFEGEALLSVVISEADFALQPLKGAGEKGMSR